MGDQDAPPAPPPAENLTYIIPEEIWDVIFGYLKAHDKLSCCNISDTCLFRHYLYPKKMVWMFEPIFPLLFGYLDNNTILTCRKICKGWSSSIDNYIQNHPCYRSIPPLESIDHSRVDTERNLLERKELSETNLESRSRMRQFMASMGNHRRNPFISRIVSIQFYDNETLRFLEMFGRHIWYLKLFAMTSDVVEFMRNIHGCLQRVPNARGMFIIGDYINTEDMENMDDVEYKAFRLQSERSLTEYFRNNKCPILPYLETVYLYFFESFEFTNAIIKNLLWESRHCEQIGRLSLSCLIEVEEGEGAVCSPEFPWYNHNWANLTELSVPIPKNEQLHELMLSNAPLKLLDLKLNTTIDYRAVANVLKNFRVTLQRLEITFVTGCYEIEPQYVFPQVTNLLNLKYFKITNGLPVVGGFIRGLANLRHLSIRWDRRDMSMARDKHLQMQRILGASPDPSVLMMGATLWDEMPSLKVCEWSWQRWQHNDEEVIQQCTRTMHAHYQNQILQPQ